MKITLQNFYRGSSTYNLLEISEFAEELRTGKYAGMLAELRSRYPELAMQERSGDTMLKTMLAAVPTVCFAAQWKKMNGKAEMRVANSMVMLQIRNVTSEAEAVRLRNLAAAIPYTLLAFVGTTGHEVVVVCRFVSNDGTDDHDKAPAMLVEAYRRLHYHYSVQLGCTIENSLPTLGTSCPVSADPDAYYNPDSETYMLLGTNAVMPELQQEENAEPHLLPNSDSLTTHMRVFEWCYKSALEKADKRGVNEQDYADATLHFLADNCCACGLPLDFATYRSGWKRLLEKFTSAYISEVFENAYESDTRVNTLGVIPSATLLTFRTEAFLKRHYQLRRNTMTGVVQFRRLDGYDYDFHDLTQADLNSMTNRALKAGITSWDKDIRRLVDSNDIPTFDPMEAFLSALPVWDGGDHVGALIGRLPGVKDSTLLSHCLRSWLLSMVAHWQGRDVKHGNALVPLLIGGQGCGKTSFCTMLLPPHMLQYYNDKVEFRNETALSLGLSSFALINIDEFDSLKRSQQPTLKYLLSKGDVKLRPPYGTAFVSRRRYASFIATTNNRRPLTDPTGSRRFICIEVPDGQVIDFVSPLDHCQLYAQLLHEVTNGARYWLTDEETKQLMEHNLNYEKVSDLEAMLNSVITTSQHDEEQNMLTVGEIVQLMQREFPTLSPSRTLSREIGILLTNSGLTPVHTRRGQAYPVKPRKE